MDPDSIALDVKVVPNPYLVRNEWERHPDFRKLKFNRRTAEPVRRRRGLGPAE
jgi:hypothetical protein